MQNPATIVQTIVDRLIDTPDLMRTVKGDARRVYAYRENAKNNNLARAIYAINAPGIMVVWMGTGSITNMDTLGLFAHRISIFIRAEDAVSTDDLSTYPNMVTALINSGATSDGRRLIDASLSPVLELPTTPNIQRIHDDESGVDAFEVMFEIAESREEIPTEE